MNAPTARDNALAQPAQMAGTRYFDRDVNASAVKVLPGEYFAATGDIAVVTVLGSCVAACLRDRERGIGGMNHFMLAGHGDDGPWGASARYGAFAMELLINHLLKLGARREALEAKAFGGGRVVAGLGASRIGEHNAGFVRRYLAAEGIPLLAEDLLGTRARRVVYFPASGRALVKRLRPSESVARLEGDYRRRIEDGADGGMEWFR